MDVNTVSWDELSSGAELYSVEDVFFTDLGVWDITIPDEQNEKFHDDDDDDDSDYFDDDEDDDEDEDDDDDDDFDPWLATLNSSPTFDLTGVGDGWIEAIGDYALDDLYTAVCRRSATGNKRVADVFSRSLCYYLVVAAAVAIGPHSSW